MCARITGARVCACSRRNTIERMTPVRLRFVVFLCLTLASSLMPPVPAYSQLPGLAQLAGQAKDAVLPPGVTRQGQLEVMGINLDGRELFKIASPAVLDRSQPGDLIPVEVRARDIEARMQRLLSRDDVASGEKLRDSLTRLDPR